jgi:hypothetical protein
LFARRHHVGRGRSKHTPRLQLLPEGCADVLLAFYPRVSSVLSAIDFRLLSRRVLCLRCDGSLIYASFLVGRAWTYICLPFKYYFLERYHSSVLRLRVPFEFSIQVVLIWWWLSVLSGGLRDIIYVLVAHGLLNLHRCLRLTNLHRWLSVVLII